MPPFPFADSPLYPWLILPAFIFLARAVDIGLSTLRIVFVAQGRWLLAPFIGFFEALIWLAVISQILRHVDNLVAVFAWAAGFAAGNALGLLLDRRLAMGMQVVRVITQRDPSELLAAFAEAGFGVTSVDAKGVKGPVKLLFSVARRRDVPALAALVERHNPRAFYSVEDVRSASEGVFPHPAAPWPRLHRWELWRAWRKAK